MRNLGILRHAFLVSAVAHMAASDEGGEELGLIELEANLSDVEKPAELPAGLYKGEIQDVQKQVSQKGNDYFSIKFVIPNDEIPADIADQFEDGATLHYNRLIVPTGKDRRALFNLRKFIEALGLDSNTTSIDPNAWMGCTARLKVVTEKYQGEERAQIKSIEAAEGKSKSTTAPAKGRGRK